MGKDNKAVSKSEANSRGFVTTRPDTGIEALDRGISGIRVGLKNAVDVVTNAKTMTNAAKDVKENLEYLERKRRK